MNTNYIMTESNVIDVYKALTNKKDIDQEEIENVRKRFFELVNY